MNRKVGRLLFAWLIFLFYLFCSSSAWAQDNLIWVDSLEDNTFYGNFCDDANWRWLCQGESFSLSSLRGDDGWYYSSQGFFGGNQEIEKKIVFSFSPQIGSITVPEKLSLIVIARSQTDSIALVSFWFDWGEGWQPIAGLVDSPWLVFNSSLDQENVIDLLAFVDSEKLFLSESWRLKIVAEPLIPGQKVMLAFDQVAIDSGVSLDPIPSPTPTPKILSDSLPEGEFTLPKPQGKVYFNKAVNLAVDVSDGSGLGKIIFQYSTDRASWYDLATGDLSGLTSGYWQYSWYPQEESNYYLRAKVYNRAGDFNLINHQDQFVFDQTSPKITWRIPVSGGRLANPQELVVDLTDNLAGVSELVRFYYRYQNGSWQEIASQPWYFADGLSLGEYHLRAQVADRAGNSTSQEISLWRQLAITNIFLVGNELSWQTSRPTICRVVYGYQPLPEENLSSNLPNLGYLWASDQLGQDKTITHRYRFPDLPTGQFFARVVALETPLVYSAEFSFRADDFLLSSSIGSTEPQVLGKEEDSTTKEQDFPTESLTNFDLMENKSGPDWNRLAVVFFLAFLAGGIAVYWFNRKRPDSQ